jgi:Ca2+-transporting ATPase
MAEFLDFKGEYKGLTGEKAAQNLDMYGENSFSETEDKSFKAHHILLNIVVLLIFLSGIIEIAFLSQVAMGIACIAIAVAGAVLLAIHCNDCNEKTEALISAAKTKYRVIRDEKIELVPAALIVPDDIIILQGGEMVPADAHILECSNLTCDESRFTGEKNPATKNAGVDNTPDVKLKSSCIYAGTRVLAGSVVARVVGTGEDAYRMRISKDRKKLPDPNFSEYERAVSRLRLPLTLIALGVSALFFVLDMIQAADSSLVMANLTEKFAFLICLILPYAELFIRIYTSRTALLCQDKGVAIKNLSVLRKLTGLTTLIIDKSAVVTPNMLEVANIYSKNDSLMTTVTILAGDKENPTLTEQAFLLNAALSGADIDLIKSNELIASFPYNENDRIGGNVYRIEDKYVLAVKGDVEKLICLCNIETAKLVDIRQKAVAISKRGLEVWASAYIIFDSPDDIPNSLYSVKYTYMGMVSFISSTRDMIPLAVQSCKKAGIKLVMTSTDSAETAASMGKKIGLACDGMITGDALREAAKGKMNLDFAHAEVFSNITTAQKTEIVDILRKNGEIVAAVGYTDEDYELITSSDLGITTLQKTTGSVYEASGLVTSDDSILQVVEIAKEARQLHRNIKKCISFCFSAFLSLVLIVLTAGFTGFLTITPAFAGVIAVAVIPVCAMCYCGCTAELKSGMSSSGFIGRGKMNKRFLIDSAISGGLIGAIAFILTAICSGLMNPAQTLATLFVMLSFSFASLSLANVSEKHSVLTILRHNAVSRRAVSAIIIIAISSAVITYIPFVNSVFGFDMPHPVALIAAVITGLVPGIVKEIMKKV